jgi:NAD-dependent dihydropyrimidine dehydrogenase PreA subunit
LDSDTASKINHFSAIGIPVVIDSELCTGCNECVEVCRAHMILPNLEKGKPPQVWYPEECWYCGCCVAFCPVGAVKLKYPINRRVGWKNKGTDKYFRIGMENPPPPNIRPPVCPEFRIEIK